MTATNSIGDQTQLEEPLLTSDSLTQVENCDTNGELNAGEEHHKSIVVHGAPLIYGLPSYAWNELYELCNLSWPVAFATLARVAVYTTDAAFIGHIGTRQMDGVSLGQAWGDLCSVIVYGPAYALNALCAQAIGADNKKLAGVWLQLALVTCTILTLITVGLYFSTGAMVKLISKNPEIPDIAQTYNQIASLILWPTVMYMALRQFFQAAQIVRPAFWVSIFTIGFNFLMNYLLVFGVNGVGGIGFLGSPLATLSSMFFQIAIYCSFVIVWKKYHAPYWGGWSMSSFTRDRIKRYAKVALPITLGTIFENWGFQMITFASGRLETADVAAMYVLYTVWGVLWAFYWGWGLALQVRIGKYLGEGDYLAAKLVTKLSIGLVIVCCSIVTVVMLSLRHEIPKIFTKDPVVCEKVSDTLPILAVDFLAGCMVLCSSSILEGMSKNAILSTVTALGTWLVSLPCAILFAFYVPWFQDVQIHGFWYGTIVGQLVESVILWYIVITTDWKDMSRIARERNERDANVLEVVEDAVEDGAVDGDFAERGSMPVPLEEENEEVSVADILSQSPAMGMSPAARSPRLR